MPQRAEITYTDIHCYGSNCCIVFAINETANQSNLKAIQSMPLYSVWTLIEYYWDSEINRVNIT